MYICAWHAWICSWYLIFSYATGTSTEIATKCSSHSRCACLPSAVWQTIQCYTGYNPFVQLYIFIVWQFSRSPILTGPTVPSNATWPSLRLGRKCATNGLLRRSPEQSTAKLWSFDFFFECILKLFGVGIVSCCDRFGPVRRQKTWCGRIWEDVAGVASLIETMEVERRAM